MFEFNHIAQALTTDLLLATNQRMHQKQEHHFRIYSKKYLDWICSNRKANLSIQI